MRLVIWHTDPYPTAPGVYLGCFPRQGHEIVWVTTVEAGERGEVRRWQEGNVTRVEVVRRADWRGWRPLTVIANRAVKLAGFARKCAVMRELARRRPDVLQVRERVTEGFLAWLWARRYGVAFAFQFDYPHREARLHELDQAGRAAPWARLTAWYWIKMRDFLLRRADLVLPISDAMADRLVSRLGLSRTKLQCFPVGIAKDLYDEAGREIGVSVPGLDSQRPVVCYVGNLWPIRRPELLFAVAAEILKREPAAQFLLMGASHPVADRLLASFPHPERLVRTGQRERREVLALLRHARVALFPLPVEDDPYGIFTTSSPLKVIEYLSAGVPVVSSRVGDAMQVLERSGGGVCVANRVEDFAAAVVELLRDPERARRMGAQGRAFVGRHRVFEALAEAIEPAYLRLAAARAAARARPVRRTSREPWVS